MGSVYLCTIYRSLSENPGRLYVGRNGVDTLIIYRLYIINYVSSQTIEFLVHKLTDRKVSGPFLDIEDLFLCNGLPQN